MKRSLRLSLTVVLLAVLLVSPILNVQAGRPRDPFVGAWESIDGDSDGDGVPDLPGADGSYQRLTIGGSKGRYNVNLKDYGATVCGVDEDGVPLYACTLKGPATAEARVLSSRRPTCRSSAWRNRPTCSVTEVGIQLQ